jgi:hypothetical protein
VSFEHGLLPLSSIALSINDVLSLRAHPLALAVHVRFGGCLRPRRLNTMVLMSPERECEWLSMRCVSSVLLMQYKT